MNKIFVATLTFFAVCSNNIAIGEVVSPTVPSTLQIPNSQKPLFYLTASGVQIHECKARKSDATKFEWTLKAPKADLFDTTGKKIGKHSAGPTWESLDGSKVVGELKSKQESPDKNAIPWLLLTAKSHQGKGIFGEVQSIQRLQTVGGKAPIICDTMQVNQILEVPYKATYYFYGLK